MVKYINKSTIKQVKYRLNCKGCGVQFTTQNKTKSNVNQCKPCINNVAKLRKRIRSVYPEPIDSVCPLCQQMPLEGKLCLDHDHATGLFRGYICRQCNSMLGNAMDNPNTLREGADYLEAFEAAVVLLGMAHNSGSCGVLRV